MIPLPRVALVGRPNVGKSTLFNRICGRRKAITDGRPGSTRDRNYAQVTWQGRAFELVDTGGLLLGSDDPLLGPATAQAERAIEESDVVLFLVDGRAGLLPDDEAIARRLRREGKRVLVVVNKTEGPEENLSEFARLGFDGAHFVSAEHGQGIGDLLDAALEGQARVEPEEGQAPPISLALVGRPNVGKSSILNRLLGRERAVVSAIPGTTRDSVDELFERGGKTYRLVDTAGIRRVRLLKENVDHVSVVQSRRAIERADVAVLVLDVESGFREMDATIGGEIVEAGAGVVVAVNKWDVAVEKKLAQRVFEREMRDAPQVPAVGAARLPVREDGEGRGDPPRRGRARPRGPQRPGHDGGAQPPARARGRAVRPEGRQGEPAGPHPLREPDRDRAAHVRGLDQPPGRPPLLLPPLPREPDPRGLRLRGSADPDQGAVPAEKAALVSSTIT